MDSVAAPAFLTAFQFDEPSPPTSLCAYGPVFQVRDHRGVWVVKRTGLVHSSGAAIGSWVTALRRAGVRTVAPASGFAPNPRTLDDGKTWVVYPYVAGMPYRADKLQIASAGQLLGRIHAAGVPEVNDLRTYEQPVVRSAEWIDRHKEAAVMAMGRAGFAADAFRALASTRFAAQAPVLGLPLVGGSFDFKASNLVFTPEPVLIDPDHAARLPRLYDLAVAALLFHNDLPSAPGKLWAADEWQTFLCGYLQHVTPTRHERASWEAVLHLAWLDQGVWLLGNFPEGWADSKEAGYLHDLATTDLSRFSLM